MNGREEQKCEKVCRFVSTLRRPHGAHVFRLFRFIVAEDQKIDAKKKNRRDTSRNGKSAGEI